MDYTPCGATADNLMGMEGDGNGWAAAPGGARVWGRHGAAGLFLIAAEPEPELLMQHRALWTNAGGTWALPGGARDSHEDAAEAAVRESVEETSIDPRLIDIRRSEVTAGPFPADPDRPALAGGWTYTTVLAVTRDGARIDVDPNEESLELRWVPLNEVEDLPLMPAFRESLPRLKTLATELFA